MNMSQLVFGQVVTNNAHQIHQMKVMKAVKKVREAVMKVMKKVREAVMKAVNKATQPKDPASDEDSHGSPITTSSNDNKNIDSVDSQITHNHFFLFFCIHFKRHVEISIIPCNRAIYNIEM